MKTIHQKIIVVLGAVLLVAACGGGGGSSKKSSAPIGDISGRWAVTEVVDESACGGGTYTDTYTLEATQSGNSLTVDTDTGVYTGSFNGNQLTWSGSFPEDGGTVRSNVKLTVDASCNSLSGSASWSWSDGSQSCSGTTRVSATRLNPAGCGSGGGIPPGGSLDGDWGGTFEDSSGRLGVITVTISGTTLSGQSPLGAFSGTVFLAQGNIWGFTLSDGTEGGFMLDSSNAHAAYVDEDGNFGVVQKGASGPSSYSGTDIVGDWQGEYVELDFGFVIDWTGTSEVTIFSDTSFFGSSDGSDTFSGELGQFSASYGAWAGSSLPNIFSSASGSGNAAAILTADKQFAGSYACFPDYAAFPYNCAFNLWTRQ